MKKQIFGLILTVFIVSASFAAEILPELNDFAESKIGRKIKLVTFSPNSPNTVEKLMKLRQGGTPNQITTEWSIVPSSMPISSSLLEMNKYHAKAALASSVKSFVRGEVSLLGYSEDMSVKIATEVTGSIIFAEILSDIREELRLEYSWENPDGSTGYGITFFLAVDKTALDKKIADVAKTVSSGNNKDIRKTDSDNPVEKTTEIRRISESVDPESYDLVKAVKELMAGNSVIQRYKEENRRLLGFEN